MKKKREPAPLCGTREDFLRAIIFFWEYFNCDAEAQRAAGCDLFPINGAEGKKKKK